MLALPFVFVVYVWSQPTVSLDSDGSNRASEGRSGPEGNGQGSNSALHREIKLKSRKKLKTKKSQYA